MKKLIFPVIAFFLLFSGAQKPAPKTPEELTKLANRSMVVIESEDEEGPKVCAGFVVSTTRGWVLTDAHCIKNPKEMTVDDIHSEVVALDEQFAILEINKMSKPSLDIAESLPIQGEQVTAVGDAFGWITTSMTHRVAHIEDGDFAVDGPYAPGMSGGPILNVDGKVVGIVQASTPIVGIACGADEIKEFIAKTVKR